MPTVYIRPGKKYKETIWQRYLKYQNLYFNLTGQRIPYLKNKTEDNRFFILTLFAIANEIEVRNGYSSDVIPIELAIRGLELRTSKVIFVGGGAILLRRQIEKSCKVTNVQFVENINANAKGYEFLYQAEAASR